MPCLYRNVTMAGPDRACAALSRQAREQSVFSYVVYIAE